MDEIETGLLSQALALPKPKYHHESTQQHHTTISSLLHKIPIVDTTTSPPSADYHLRTTPRSRSISSSNPLNEFLKPHSILSQNNSSESDEDDSSHHDEINLYPLSNQVGGHTRLLLLNDKTVIKPLNFRELEFYQNIPADIQHFVPKYKGDESENLDQNGELLKFHQYSIRISFTSIRHELHKLA